MQQLHPVLEHILASAQARSFVHAIFPERHACHPRRQRRLTQLPHRIIREHQPLL
jgi:hypothetical protein